MVVPSVTELIPVLQVAIGPVILISGIGLVLLSMTNRLGPHSALPDGDFAGWQVVMPTSLQSFAQCRRDAHFV